jgi:UPF0755 protein
VSTLSPRRRQGGGLRTFAVGLLVLVLLLGGGALAGYTYYNSQVHSSRRAGQPSVTVNIPTGTSTSSIANILESQGVIGSKLVFQAYVKLNNFELQAGPYTIPGGTSLADVVALLSHNQEAAAVTVTIPEGYTAKQIGALLAKKGLVSADALLAATMQPYQADFLAGHDPALSLDGYLFPDTYQFSVKATPQDVINVLLRRFGEKVTPDLRAKAPPGITLAQAVVMASIVEREAFFNKDRAAVAGVFYNRLSAGMPLQSDATVAYAKGQGGANITEDDKRINSPYNTYLHTGLPPGGISNPGLASLQAAFQPMKTDYLFYLTDKDGHAHFSKTYAQHQQCQVDLSVCPTLP